MNRMWKLSSDTSDYLSELEKEIKTCEKELSDGALIVSPALEREFCRAIGYLEGLKFSVKKATIEIQEENTNEFTETVSRKVINKDY